MIKGLKLSKIIKIMKIVLKNDKLEFTYFYLHISFH